MQFTYAAVAAIMAGVVAAGGNETWVTTTVDTYTTVCPAATSLTYNGVTYTATASETITITNCPCTISYKPTTTPVVVPTTPAYVNATVPATTPATTPVVTSPAVSVPVGTGSPAPTTTGPAPFTGAANKAAAGSAAGLFGLLGLAAYIL